jgi:hypothetical protein
VIRAVLAVALATAIVAAALPVLDDARQRRSDRSVRGEVAAVERAANALLAADETAPGPGARRVVPVSLPERSWTTAGVDEVAIEGSVGRSHRESAATYTIGDGPTRRVGIGAPLYTPDGPVVLEGNRGAELVLELVRVDGRAVVAVRRRDRGRPRNGGPDPDHALRGFIPEPATTTGHVHPRSDRRGVRGVPLPV